METFESIFGLVGGHVFKKKHDNDFFYDIFKNEDYQKRYMIISSTHLKYYHTKPSDLSEGRDSEIPLGIVLNVQTRCIKESETKIFWIFTVEIPVREFSFKVSDQHAAEAWAKAILNTRDFYLRKILGRVKPLPIDESSLKTKFWIHKPQKTDFFSGFSLAGSKSSVPQNSSHGNNQSKSPHEPVSSNEVDMIIDLENSILMDKRIMKQLVFAFFDRLKSLPKRVATEKCKQLGLALSMWVGLGDVTQPTARIRSWIQSGDNSLLNMDSAAHKTHDNTPQEKKSPTADEIIRLWISVSLARELERSCDTHKAMRSNQSNDFFNMPSVSEGDKVTTDPTKQSSSTLDEFEGQDIPFRGDHHEAVFITQFLRATIQVSGIIGQWLAQIILTTSKNPENYTFTNTNVPLPIPPVAESTDESTNTVISSKNPTFAASMTTARHSLYLAPKASKKFLNNNDCVYFTIIRACSVIVQTIHAFKINMPNPLLIFIHSLKALTLGLDFQSWSDNLVGPLASFIAPRLSSVKTGFSLHQENSVSGENQLLDRIFDAPDERVYLKSLSAVFFLRLICPAIISPMDWGSLHQWLSKSDQSSTLHQPSIARYHPSAMISSNPSIITQSDSNMNTTAVPSETNLLPLLLSSQHGSCSSGGSGPSTPSREGSRPPSRYVPASNRPFNSLFHPNVSNVMVGSPTAFLMIIASVLGRDLDDSNEKVDASASPSSWTPVIGKKQSEESGKAFNQKDDFVDYFRGGSEDIDYDLILKAKEVKQKLNQLSLVVNDAIVSKILLDYHASTVELSEEDHEEILAIGRDINSLPVQFGLIEVAKVMQKIANMACMTDADMEAFISSDMIWQRKRSGQIEAKIATATSEPNSKEPASTQSSLTLDETGKLFAQELTIVAKMLRKFYIDSSLFSDGSKNPWVVK